MKPKTKAPNPNASQRRRFLRESILGSAPLILGLASGAAHDPADPADEPDSAREPSAPPQAADAAPAAVKESLDKKQEEFARDNPGLTRYPSN